MRQRRKLSWKNLLLDHKTPLPLKKKVRKRTKKNIGSLDRATNSCHPTLKNPKNIRGNKTLVTLFSAPLLPPKVTAALKREDEVGVILSGLENDLGGLTCQFRGGEDGAAVVASECSGEMRLPAKGLVREKNEINTKCLYATLAIMFSYL